MKRSGRLATGTYYPVQPQSMDPAELKKRYGDKLTFWGTLDN